MITCLIVAVLNLFLAMNSTNPNPLYHWMASGYCFGLFMAMIVVRVSK